MRLTLAAAVLVSSSLLVAGCGSSDPDEDGADGGEGSAAELTFEYRPRGEAGFIDQTLAITNAGEKAAAPDLDLVPLDADGAELDGVEIATAYGSDAGAQVVPALTEVVEILQFTGDRAAEVADVRVEVADLHELDEDVPPANDLQVVRIDLDGKRGQASSTLGSIALRNTYDAPVTVVVVGIEYADVPADELQQFTSVVRLAGPVRVEPGEKVRSPVPARYRTTFFGSVKAYLSSETPAGTGS